MALTGPQIGGVSLLVHTLVIILVWLKTMVRKFISTLASLFQKISHPSRPNSR